MRNPADMTVWMRPAFEKSVSHVFPGCLCNKLSLSDSWKTRYIQEIYVVVVIMSNHWILNHCFVWPYRFVMFKSEITTQFGGTDLFFLVETTYFRKGHHRLIAEASYTLRFTRSHYFHLPVVPVWVPGARSLKMDHAMWAAGSSHNTDPTRMTSPTFLH